MPSSASSARSCARRRAARREPRGARAALPTGQTCRGVVRPVAGHRRQEAESTFERHRATVGRRRRRCDARTHDGSPRGGRRPLDGPNRAVDASTATQPGPELDHGEAALRHELGGERGVLLCFDEVALARAAPRRAPAGPRPRARPGRAARRRRPRRRGAPAARPRRSARSPGEAGARVSSAAGRGPRATSLWWSDHRREPPRGRLVALVVDAHVGRSAHRGGRGRARVSSTSAEQLEAVQQRQLAQVAGRPRMYLDDRPHPSNWTCCSRRTLVRAAARLRGGPIHRSTSSTRPAAVSSTR